MPSLFRLMPTNSISARRSFRLRAAAAASIALLFAVAAAQAQSERSWTSIGAAGAVTPTQQSLIEHSLNWARIPVSLNSATVTLRYNINAVDGLFPPGFGVNNFAFGARYIDNGAGGQVQWRLRSYNHDNGTTTTIASVDSNDMPQSASAQDNFKCIAANFDFSVNSYYTEVVLTKTALAGRAQVGSVWLKPTGCLVGP